MIRVIFYLRGRGASIIRCPSSPLDPIASIPRLFSSRLGYPSRLLGMSTRSEYSSVGYIPREKIFDSAFMFENAVRSGIITSHSLKAVGGGGTICCVYVYCYILYIVYTLYIVFVYILTHYILYYIYYILYIVPRNIVLHNI